MWKWGDEMNQVLGGGDVKVSDVKWPLCAYQTTHFSCGYHTVFNGWAVALGLRLNPKFDAIWDDEFLTQVFNVIGLAIMGKTSSDMIHNFLACIEFVYRYQVVEKSNRFERTVVGTEFANLTEEWKNLVKSDEAWWRDKQGEQRIEEIKKIRHIDRIPFPDNRAYNSEWPSDDWHNAFNLFIPNLVYELHDKIDICELNSNQLFYQLRLHSEEFANSDVHQELEKSHVHDLLKEYRGQIRKAESSLATIQKFHHFMRLDILEPGFIEEDAEWLYEIHSEYLSALLGEPLEPSNKVERLSWDVTLRAVAAVLQAIDQKQSQQAAKNGVIHAGGFALTSETPIFEGQGPLARPRRCWLLPWQYQEMETLRAHNFLAVLQEEKKADDTGSQFCVYFLDSAPDMWKKRKGERFNLFKLIKEKARGLSWTTHRNPNGRVKFSSKPRYVNVTKQVSNLACGYHTVVNAWILALGMTPKVKPKKTLDLREASSMIKFAIRGVLDWKTLVAWLFYRDLTVETKIEQVTLSRAFEVTKEQKGQEKLLESIETEIVHDEILSMWSEKVVPYVRNNVDFSGGKWTFEPEETLEEEEDDSQQDNESPGALQRSTEDVDMLYYEYEDEDDDEEWSFSLKTWQGPHTGIKGTLGGAIGTGHQWALRLVAA